MLGEHRILDTPLIVKQVVFRFIRHRLAEIQSFRNVKAHSAAKQRRQRSHLNTHPRGREVNRDTAVFPEANVSRHQTVVRRVDKQLISDAALLRIKGAGFNRTDAIAAEQHRIARRELPRFTTFQQNTDTFGIR